MSENAAPGSAAPLDSAQKEQIRQLLRSHLPPPLHLPSTISALALELAQYDTQIARVPQNMDQLLVQRAEVQAHYTNCMGLFAPIRQIPTEILVEIFKMCWEAFVSTIGPGAGSMSLAGEMSRLAHAPLLTLSQVCIRWHTIALGTPALWCDIDVEAILWADPLHVDNNMNLLRAALERSGNHPLSVSISNECAAIPHVPAYDLISRHSERWETVVFECRFSDLLPLSGIKGRLPNVENLHIYCWGDDAVRALETFRDLPRLRRIDFCPIAGRSLAQLPWEQLNDVECWEFRLHGNESVIPTILPRFIPRRHDVETDQPLEGPSVRSDIAVLVIQVSDFSPTIAPTMLEFLLATLTLPLLHEFVFVVQHRYSDLPFLWPHSQFLSLADRSSFHSHLHMLEYTQQADAETVRRVETVQPFQCIASGNAT
ncbi:hypothetical protein B0H14DRAFT_2815255 [Mycena olivaceomarginata]|nr:hypothetical protein B0H14DRAFT_2815255 [Mycena olivaceomarginata]